MSSESKKKILFIAPQPFFLNRGTPINVRAMVETLAEDGFEVDLLAFPFGESIECLGLGIVRSPKVPGISSVPIGPSWRKLVLDVPLLFKAVSLQRRNKYDMVHGIEEGAFIAGLVSSLFNVPFVFDMDSSMSEQLQSSGFLTKVRADKVFIILERFFIRRAAAVLTVCEALSDKAKALVPTANIVQIEDFPFGPACKVEPSICEALRVEFSLAEDRVNILYTGNFEAYQGLKLLLKSFALMVERKRAEGVESPQLVLVGGGKLSDPLVVEHKELAESLGISSEVLFVGARPAEEMGSWMELADVLVSPRAEGENTPLKLYSYMAAGKAIVATNIRSHTQVLSADSAFLTEPTAEQFSIALETSTDSTELGLSRRVRLAKVAKDLVESRYSEKEFKRKLTEFYRGALGVSLQAEPSRELDAAHGHSVKQAKY